MPILRSCRARLPRPRTRGQLAGVGRHVHHAAPPVLDSSRPSLRMAVVGSGPAGFYTAYRVMGKIPARVDMYEALPVPFGLARFGVAPDHPEVKNCEEKFDEVAQSPDFRFLGNVAVGGRPSAGQGAVSLDVLARHYDAVVFAYGASRDRRLGVPGESLRGVYAARDFVGWYNGMPSDESPQGDGQDQQDQQDQQDRLYQELAADLERASDGTAVVVGQGNVALDVARMLLEDVDVLRRTDMSEAAVAALARSRVRRVHVVGRRGPMQAAFTIKEARELMRLPGVAMHAVDAGLLPPTPAALKALPRPLRRLMEVVAKGSETADVGAARASWSLDFCLAPQSFAGDAREHVTSAVFQRTRLSDAMDPLAHVVASDEPAVCLPADLVFRSIGYRAEPLAGFDALSIAFDERRGLIRNDGYGRVLHADSPGGRRPGFYCVGWVKRGPTGVIASTMQDAFTTADALVQDWLAGAPFLGQGETRGGWEGVRAEVYRGDTADRVVSWADWKRIDEVEVERGRQQGKPRSKLTRRADMLAVLS